MTSIQEIFKKTLLHLTEPVSGAALSLFRIFFGLFIIADAVFFIMGRKVYFPQHVFHFSYPGLEWWPTLSPVTMWICLGGLVLFGLMIAIGLCEKMASFGVFCILLNLLLQDATFYLNHLVLSLLVAFVFCLVPTGTHFSIQSRLMKNLDSTARSKSIARYEHFWVMGLFLSCYFLGGIEKLRSDWFSGDILAVNFGLSSRKGNLIGKFMTEYGWMEIPVWMTLVLELVVPFLLFHKKTRWIAVSLLGGFHILNHFSFNIGLFSFLMLAALVLYPDPAWPLQLRFFNRSSSSPNRQN